MTALTEDQKKRLRDVSHAIRMGWLDKVENLGRDDLVLAIKRIEELDVDDRADAGEFIPWAVERMKEDLEQKREWLADAIENVRVAELCVMEADHAYHALKALADGGLFISGDEINKRFDAVTADYYARGLLVEPEAPAEPAEVEAEPEAAPAAPEPPVIVEAPPVATEPPKADPPPPKPFVPRVPPVTLDAAEQDRRMFDALKVAAGDQPEIQVSLKVLSATSGVAQGSALFTLRRLEAAGRIVIIPDNTRKGTKRPNVYRFIQTAPEAQPPPEDPTDPVTEVPDPPSQPPRPAKTASKVTDASALRDRIASALEADTRSSMALASLLDVKELMVCQTLTAMQHEGRVEPLPMPEAGRRAQEWRLLTAH